MKRNKLQKKLLNTFLRYSLTIFVFRQSLEFTNRHERKSLTDAKLFMDNCGKHSSTSQQLQVPLNICPKLFIIHNDIYIGKRNLKTCYFFP